MPKHTPAPWYRGASLISDAQHRPLAVVLHDGDGTTRDTDRQAPATDEAMANARLIADAPHMLGVLRRLCEWEARMGGFDAMPWREARALLTRQDTPA